MSPGPKSGDLRIRPLGETLGIRDHAGKAALANADPFRMNLLAIAHEDSLPVPDEILEGFLRAAAMDHEEGHRAVHHDPEPVNHAVATSGGLVHIVDRRGACSDGDGFVVGLDGGAHAVKHLLDASETDGNAEHRGATRLYRGPTVSLNTLRSAMAVESLGPEPFRCSPGISGAQSWSAQAFVAGAPGVHPVSDRWFLVFTSS